MLATIAATVTTPLSLPCTGLAPQSVVVHEATPAALPVCLKQSAPRAPPHA
jgi:hypothetical protein